MDRRTECAVEGCTGKMEGFHNLCRDHAVPGIVAKTGHSTMIVTMWYAERGTEYGTWRVRRRYIPSYVRTMVVIYKGGFS